MYPFLLVAFFFFAGGYPSLQNTVQVIVNIVDVNDNSPIIMPNSYVASVRENLPSGQSVIRVGTLRPQTYDSKMSAAIEVPDVDYANDSTKLFSKNRFSLKCL